MKRTLPIIILAAALFAAYLATLAPGLSWANAGVDGGDLITAAATNGVAHPTGYPTYLILAKLFQHLPIGSFAFRTNVLSAVVTVLASVFLYCVVIRFLDATQTDHSWLAGLIVGFAFGLAPLVWSQAVITEVYALNALFVVLILFLANTGPGRYNDLLIGLTLGLAMGNHITAIFLLPIALWVKDGRSFARRLIFLLLGLCVYLLLPWWASFSPPVNWGNPTTMDRFWWLVSGRLYVRSLFPIELGELWIHLQAWAALLMNQWGLIGLLLALFGFVYFYSHSRLYFITLWITAVYSSFAILYRSDDSYLYLIPVVIAFSIWMGIGMAKAISRLRRDIVGVSIGLLFLLYLLGFGIVHASEVDASHDLRAENFGRDVLQSAPQNAIIFSTGDEAVFTLWYFHFALQERPDLVIIATDLLGFDWYRATLAFHYPALKITNDSVLPALIIHDNQDHPVCFVQYFESKGTVPASRNSLCNR